jgi:tetratricopeptide (TPR) repeat protein
MSLIMDAIKRAQQLRLKEQMETHPLKGFDALRQKKRIGGKFIGLMTVAGLGLVLVLFVWGPSPSSFLISRQEQTVLPVAKPYLPDDSIDPKESQEPTKERVELPQIEKTSSLVNPPIDKNLEESPAKQRTKKKTANLDDPSDTGSEKKPAFSPLAAEPSPQKLSSRQKEETSTKPVAIAPERAKTSAPVSDVLFHFNLGVQFYHQREISKAIQAYRKVIEIDPTYVEAYNNLGVIYQEIGDFNNALWAYQTSLGINPRYEKGLNNLGILLYLMERYEESMEALQKSLAINSNHVESHINLGILFKKRGQMDQAIACYQKVLSINPGHGEAHYNIGLLYEQLENVELAISHYQKFIQFSKKTHPDLVAKVQRHLNTLIAVKEKNKSSQ